MKRENLTQLRGIVIAVTATCLLGLSGVPGLAQTQRKFPWDNTHQPIQQRVHELVSRMTLQEKVSQTMNTAPAIQRLGVPAYNWWSEGPYSKIPFSSVNSSAHRTLALKDARDSMVLLMAGSAVALDWSAQHVAAIVDAWYPGEAGGAAIGETLSGVNDPGGKLPLTFYRSVKQLPPFTDYSMKGRTHRYFTGTPLFPFGYGLSYTEFAYSHAHLSRRDVKAGEPLAVDADVTNTGKMTASAVTELYPVPPRNGLNALHSLEGFDRVWLAPGQTRHLTFTLGARQLSVVNAAGQRNVEPGQYRIFVGGSQPAGNAAQSVNVSIHGTKHLPE